MPHIHLIAPSYPISATDIDLTKQTLENLGMKVTVPEDILGKDLLCANTDERRLLHLKNALNDSSADIIWALNGGYGLSRLITDLFTMKRPEKEKLFIGFSDGTALHTFLNQVWNWPSLHGLCASHIHRKKTGDKSIEKTLTLLKKGLISFEPPILTPFNPKARTLSSLSGQVVGGNLCLLECSLGTKWQINPSNKILFLEEVDERGYRVDRMLAHLYQADVFKEVKAIILGDFTGGEEPNGTSFIPPVLERFSGSLDVPIFRLEGYGHGAENFPLVFDTPLHFPV